MFDPIFLKQDELAHPENTFQAEVDNLVKTNYGSLDIEMSTKNYEKNTNEILSRFARMSPQSLQVLSVMLNINDMKFFEPLLRSRSTYVFDENMNSVV